jgi:hypothetical protein
VTASEPTTLPGRPDGDRRRRAATLLVLLAIGLVLAILLASTTGAGPADPGAASGATSSAPGPTDGGSEAPTVDQPDEAGDGAGDGTHPWAHSPRTIAISAQGGLPEGLADDVADEPGIEVVTVVRGATLGLVGTRTADGEPVDELPDGWRFPVEVLAVDAAGYHELLDVPEVAALGPDEALLSESSASVRRLGPGGQLSFRDGTTLTVAAVLPDAVLGAAEVLVTTGSPLTIEAERYLLARAGQPLDPARRAELLALAGPRATLELGGEVPVLRHAASVMPPARLKVHFGEFAMTDGPDRWIHQGVTWLREYYAEEEVPILGATECHRDMFPPLRAAMQELVDRGLAHLVDGDDFGGCWAPRTQGSAALSSHAWGVAVDLNVAGNHYGAEPTMPPEVIEVMAAHGFAWGGEWPVPDGMHFELVVDRGSPPDAG